MRPELVVLYIVAGAFTAALAGLTQPSPDQEQMVQSTAICGAL